MLKQVQHDDGMGELRRDGPLNSAINRFAVSDLITFSGHPFL
jgi:hypothetical protein